MGDRLLKICGMLVIVTRVFAEESRGKLLHCFLSATISTAPPRIIWETVSPSLSLNPNIAAKLFFIRAYTVQRKRIESIASNLYFSSIVPTAKCLVVW